MSDEIRINATPTDDTSCRFTVDRPLFEGGSFYFGNAELAKGSPLAERLFAIPGVASILVQDETVTVSTGGPVDWRSVGPAVGRAIRETLASGEAVVSDSLLADLPSADEIRTKVQSILEREINPAVASHGGWIEVIDVRRNEVFLRLGGGCQGCGAANVTLKHGVERLIREQVPEVGAIMDTTDHASGRNPYYSPAK